jgi:hypothetical protein
MSLKVGSFVKLENNEGSYSIVELRKDNTVVVKDSNGAFTVHSVDKITLIEQISFWAKIVIDILNFLRRK